MLVDNGERFLAVGDMLKRHCRVGKVIDSGTETWENETSMLLLNRAINLDVQVALCCGVLIDHRSVLRHDTPETPFTTIFADSTTMRSHMEDKRSDLLPPAPVDYS